MAVQERSIPPVWPWYVGYCVLMALLYLLVGGAGLLALFIDLATLELEEDAMIVRIQGVLFLVLGLIFMIVYAAAPFLPKRPWVWIYGLVMIAIGIASICCLPVTIPLLIFWLKPETQQFFERK